jgi:hypothetical protein
MLRQNCACLSLRFFAESPLAHQPLIQRLVRIPIRNFLISAVILGFATQASFAGSFPLSGPTTPGNIAKLSGKLALAPANAPMAVKRAIWAANQLRTKPYRFGGGHKTFHDNAYDCSGTVSYALAGAGLVSIPMNSKEFRVYGNRGRGKWITIYARKGHTFAVIAGLRLDTTSPNNPSRRWAPRWQPTDRTPRGFEARHPVGL